MKLRTLSTLAIPLASNASEANQYHNRNMKITVTSTFGNFKYEINAEVTPEQRDALAIAGLLQIAQRKPATAAEKELGWGGAKKRPEGFKRTDIEFSAEAAATLKKHLEAGKLEIGEGDDAKEEALLLDVVVTEYSPEKAEVKWKEEKAILARKSGDAEFEALAKRVGYVKPEGGWSKDDVEFCKAIRVYTKAQLAGM